MLGIAVAFFFSTLAVEGDEAFEDGFVKTLTPCLSPRGRRGQAGHNQVIPTVGIKTGGV